MMDCTKSLAAGALLLGVVAGCENDSPAELVGGPVYDFRMAVEATAAGALPGGTVQLFVRGTIVDSARLTLRGLGGLASGYTLFTVTEPAGQGTPAVTGIMPDSLGVVVVRVPGAALEGQNDFVLGFGAADFAGASRPLFFQFRNPTTGALTASGALALGRFTGAVATSPRFLTPAATLWGRGGLWLDQPRASDIWLRGYVLHLPVAPNGFEWAAWAVKLAGDTIKAAARLEALTDSTSAAITDFETPPTGATVQDFPKVFFEGFKCDLGVLLEDYTHVVIALEPRGATSTRPAAAVVYRGRFPQQFKTRFATPDRIPQCS